MLEEFKESLERAPIIKKGDYDYFVHPITDGIPALEPKLVNELAYAVSKIINPDTEKIVTVEAMGIPIATALSLKINKPFCIIRKKAYGLEGEVKLKQTTGYSYSFLYINGMEKGEKIAVIDDVLSTGGTIKACVNGLKKIGVKIVDIIVLIEKGENKEELEKQIGLKIKSLVKVGIVNGKVKVL